MRRKSHGNCVAYVVSPVSAVYTDVGCSQQTQRLIRRLSRLGGSVIMDGFDVILQTDLQSY